MNRIVLVVKKTIQSIQLLLKTDNRVETQTWIVYCLVWSSWFLYNLFRSMEFNIEEVAGGNLARGLSEGLVASPWFYQYNPLTYGTLVYSVLLYPFFKLFGSYYIWVKLAGALFAIGGTTVWIAVVRLSLGFRAACLFAIWLLLPPPLVNDVLHIAWANHMDSIFFTGMLIYLFLRIDEDRPTPSTAFKVGLFGGFAAFFCMQNLASASAVAAACFLRWKLRKVWLSIIAAAGGFLAGYSPHWIYQIVVFREAEALPMFLGTFSHNPFLLWRDLIFIHLPQSFNYSLPHFSEALLALSGLAVLYGTLHMPVPFLRRIKPADRKSWFYICSVFYFICYMVAYDFSKFTIGPPLQGFALSKLYAYRYLSPVFPFIMAIVCGLLSRLPPWAGFALLTPFYVAGFVDIRNGFTNYNTFRFYKDVMDYPLFSMRGDNFQVFIGANLRLSWKTVDDALDSVSKLAQKNKREGYEEVGKWLGPEKALAYFSLKQDRFEEYDFHIACGAGKSVAELWIVRRLSFPEGYLNDMRRIFDSLFAIDKGLAENFVDGLAQGISMTAFSHSPDYEEEVKKETAPLNGPIVWKQYSKSEHVRAMAVISHLGSTFPKWTHPFMARGVGMVRVRHPECIPKKLDEQALSFMQYLYGFEPSPEVLESYIDGIEEGIAYQLMICFNRFYWPNGLPPEIKLPNIQKNLKERGIKMTVLGRQPLRIQLDDE